MAFFELDDIFTYQDANEIKQLWAADTPPEEPGDGEVWLDTSINPAKLKRYTDNVWQIIGDTPAESMLDLIKTVDGSGSGLDADLLDGKDSDDFVQFDSNGYVGVGTTTPEYQIHVREDSSAATILAERNDIGLQTILKATGTVSQIGSRSNHDLQLMTGNAARVTIDNAGKVGIGTIDPTDTLEINTTGEDACLLVKRTDGALAELYAKDTRVSIGSQSNHDLRLTVNGESKVAITTDGYVGIGTTTPATTFDVSGSAKFSGTVTINDHLVIRHDGTNAYIQSKTHGQSIFITGENSSGEEKVILNLEPDNQIVRAEGGIVSEIYDGIIQAYEIYVTNILHKSTGLLMVRFDGEEQGAFYAISAPRYDDITLIPGCYNTALWSNTKDTSLKVNVYFENSRVYVQNNRPNDRTFKISFFGCYLRY